MNDGTRVLDHIDYNGYCYVYERRPGKNGEICLATKDPTKYCNGFYSQVKNPLIKNQYMSHLFEKWKVLYHNLSFGESMFGIEVRIDECHSKEQKELVSLMEYDSPIIGESLD